MFDSLRREAAQALRFAAVGLLSNVVYFGALGLAVPFGGMPLWLGSAAAYACSMVCNYLLQRSVTFRSERPHAETVAPYVAVQAASLVVNSALLAWLVSNLELSFAVGQTLALIATTALNFACQKSWVFGRRPSRDLLPASTPTDLSA